MKKVLIVEDYTMFRSLLRSILELEGLSCLEATNGVDAYAQLQKSTIEIIITDHEMPLMNGIELLKRLPQIYSGTFPLVIFLTGSYTETLEREAKSLGAAVVFKKPIQVPDLLAYLGQVALPSTHV